MKLQKSIGQGRFDLPVPHCGFPWSMSGWIKLLAGATNLGPRSFGFGGVLGSTTSCRDCEIGCGQSICVGNSFGPWTFFGCGFVSVIGCGQSTDGASNCGPWIVISYRRPEMAAHLVVCVLSTNVELKRRTMKFV
jgi:hypothetical protein